ncbi:hypothetical protein SCLCIDRAFT_31969 [Scleroderma citrinum Foug A]|uniref:Uncharacterized protein n=1 Tax=Scleroderma citrinum Foug A TaxID=1036808 RepID=A0A0C3DAZ5_9AGAM|nr:hypothetical protein SCLCIDRAFT_31969 [Scleroderma citrinum Foug A]
MASQSQKHHQSPSTSCPTKKVKGKAQVHQSDCSGKGIGGAVEQLQKAGDAVAPQSKRRFDAFEDTGEGLNPMVSESPIRKSKKSKKPVMIIDNDDGPSLNFDHPLSKLPAAKNSHRVTLDFSQPSSVPAPDEWASCQQALESDIRPNTIAAGQKLIMDERRCQEQEKKK